MNILDIRTILLYHVVVYFISTVVVIALWHQNRNHFRGLHFLALNSIFQFLGVLLFFLRGIIPDWISIVVANTIIVLGSLFILIGLQQFVGKKSRQYYNIALVILFSILYTYFGLVQHSLAIRKAIFGITGLILMGQILWLLIFGMSKSLKEIVSGLLYPIVIFTILLISTLVGAFVIQVPNNDYLSTGFFDAIILLGYQLTFLLWAYGLYFVINKRLLFEDKRQDIRFKTLIENSSQGTVILQEDPFRIRFVSPPIKNISGYSAEEVLAFSKEQMLEVIHPDDRQLFLNNFKNRLMGQPAERQYEIRLYAKSGKMVWVQLNSSRIQYEDGYAAQAILTDISERKKYEEQLIASEKQFKTLGEVAPVYIAIQTHDGDQFLYVNQHWSHITGYSIEHALRRSGAGKVRPIDVVHPDMRNQVLQYASDRIQGKPAPDNYEIKIRTKEKNIRWLNYFVTLIRFENIDAIMTIGIDVTESKKSKEKVLSLMKNMDSILSSAGDGIYGLNLEGNATFVNPAGCKILGWTEAEILGKNQHKMVHHSYENGSDYDPVNCPIFNVLKDGKTRKMDTEYFWCKDGTSFPVEYVSTAQFDNDNNIIGAVVTFKNITIRKQQEEELRKAKFDAEVSDRLKSVFLSNMSHEIRTPISSLVGFADLLSNHELTEDEKKQFSTIIKSNSVHLLRLIDDVLDVSKLEVNQLKIYPIKFTFKNFAINIEAQFKQILIDKKKADSIILKTHFHVEDETQHLFTDIDRLKQIIMNLFINAVKFSSNGTIEVGCHEKNELLEFYIKDEGRGISSEDVGHIFDRFGQAMAMEKTEGTGLGLSIVQGLVTLLGGELAVDSTLGKGSTFTFTILKHLQNQNDKRQ